MNSPTPETHWACACVKRKAGKPGFFVKLNPATRSRCGVCGCKKSTMEKYQQREAAMKLKQECP